MLALASVSHATRVYRSKGFSVWYRVFRDTANRRRFWPSKATDRMPVVGCDTAVETGKMFSGAFQKLFRKVERITAAVDAYCA